MFLTFLQFFYFIIILSFVYFLLLTQTSQRRLLCMIFVLLNFAFLLLFLHYEYVAFIIIILYIGAICVLFLFIIMFVNVTKVSSMEAVYPLSLFFYIIGFGFIFLEFLSFNNSLVYIYFFVDKIKMFNPLSLLWIYFIEYESNLFDFSFFVLNNLLTFVYGLEIIELGFLFWTNHGFVVLLSSFILIISIIGSVSILKGIFIFNLYKKKYLSLKTQKSLLVNKNFRFKLYKKKKIPIFWAHCLASGLIHRCSHKFFMKTLAWVFYKLYKGALTNKPQAFKFRVWELESIRTREFFDSFVDNIIVEIRGLEIMRILPINYSLQIFNWLTDKTRFFFDSIKYQRVYSSLLFLSEKTFQMSWLYVLLLTTFFLLKLKQTWLKLVCFKTALKPFFGLRFNFVGFNTAFFSDFYTLYNVSSLFRSIGGGVIFGKNISMQTFCYQNKADVITNFCFDHVFNGHSFVFLNGLDVRYDLPKLYLFLKQKLKSKFFKIFVFNIRFLGIQSFNYIHLGYNLSTFVKLLEGRHWVNNFLIKKKKDIKTNFHFFFTGHVLTPFLNVKNISDSIKFFCMKYSLKWFHLHTKINSLNLSFLNFRFNFTFFQGKNFQDFLINFQGIFFHENLQNKILNLSLHSQFVNILLSNFHQYELEKKLFSYIKLPMLTLFERDFLMINLFGKVTKLKGFLFPEVVNEAGKIVAKSSFDFCFVLFCLVNLKTTTKFLKFLKTLFSSEQVFKDQKYFIKKLIFGLYKFNNNNMDQIFNCFISNFYKMDEYSKNSIVLNNANVFYYKDINNYVL